MRVVGKSTCSGFKTGLHISFHSRNAARYRNRGFKFLIILISNNYMTVLRTEQILHNFEDRKFANFFSFERVNFHVTLIIYGKLVRISSKNNVIINI